MSAETATDFSAHLPALAVMVPLMTAPLVVIFRNSKVAFGLSLAAAWSVFGMILKTLMLTLEHGGWVYELGGWKAPIGIVYNVDTVAAFVMLIVSGIGALVLSYAPMSVAREIPENRQTLFYSAFLLAMTGLLGMTITGDAFNVFVFLEISSLASYTLVAMGSSRNGFTAAYRYLIMGAIGGTFILIGIGLMYMMTGTLNMADLAERLPEVAHTRTIMASFAFVIVGAGLKLALWPMHTWLPNAYTYAPSVASAFISATGTKVMVYVMLRFVFGIYGTEFAFTELSLGLPFAVLGLGGIYAASTAAIFQTNFKRLLAYSSVGQIGYIVLGMSLATVGGLAAAILHLFNHAIMKAGLFMAAGHINHQVGSVRLADLEGIGRKMPITMGLIAIGGAGLIGVPLTVGFVSKWVLISALAEQDLWWVVGLALASSLLAVAYIWRFVEVAWIREPAPALEHVTEVPFWLWGPTAVMMTLSIVFGVWGAGTTEVAMEAARILLGVAA